MTLLHLTKYVVTKLWYIALGLCIVLSLATGIIKNKFMNETYTSEASLLVNDNRSKKTTIGFEAIQANAKLVEVYKDVAYQPVLFHRVVDSAIHLEQHWTAEKVKKSVSITNKTDSPVMKVQTTANSKLEAKKLNAIVVESIIKEVNRSVKTNNLSIISKPTQPRKGNGPSLKIMIASAITCSILLTYLIGYTKNSMSE